MVGFGVILRTALDRSTGNPARGESPIQPLQRRILRLAHDRELPGRQNRSAPPIQRKFHSLLSVISV